MAVDYSGPAVAARLREQGRRADLRSSNRLLGKLEMTAGAILRRLRHASRLREACLRLGRARPVDGPGE